METAHRIGSDVAYAKRLIGAGWNGISDARHELHDQVFAPPLKRSAWTPMALGAAVGLLGTRVVVRRRTPLAMVVAGAAGLLVGLGAAAAWTSRRFTREAGRAAAQRVGAARDARWLELNPIDYA